MRKRSEGYVQTGFIQAVGACTKFIEESKRQQKLLISFRGLILSGLPGPDGEKFDIPLLGRFSIFHINGRGKISSHIIFANVLP